MFHSIFAQYTKFFSLGRKSNTQNRGVLITQQVINTGCTTHEQVKGQDKPFMYKTSIHKPFTMKIPKLLKECNFENN